MRHTPPPPSNTRGNGLWHTRYDQQRTKSLSTPLNWSLNPNKKKWGIQTPKTYQFVYARLCIALQVMCQRRNSTLIANWVMSDGVEVPSYCPLLYMGWLPWEAATKPTKTRWVGMEEEKRELNRKERERVRDREWGSKWAQSIGGVTKQHHQHLRLSTEDLFPPQRWGK